MTGASRAGRLGSAAADMETPRRIAITLGDAAGIGPELTSAALASGRLDPGFEYEIIGVVPPGTVAGHPTIETARAAGEALETAVRRALNREFAAVVTGPVSKSALHAIGFSYPGQTEFFADRCGCPDFAMILTGKALTVGLVSIHVPLRKAIEDLSPAEITRVGRQLADFLAVRQQSTPRNAVAGIKTHPAEGGVFGREEIERVAPAIAELNARAGAGASFHGPLSPDTVFHEAAQGAWDGVLCMYHDQGLIPLKLHAFDEGVNVTWGLPILRTSPDHGTAFAIAGRGVARPDSMIAAIRLAGELALGRERGESRRGG